jgi:hypothetical protein
MFAENRDEVGKAELSKPKKNRRCLKIGMHCAQVPINVILINGKNSIAHQKLYKQGRCSLKNILSSIKLPSFLYSF